MIHGIMKRMLFPRMNSSLYFPTSAFFMVSTQSVKITLRYTSYSFNLPKYSVPSLSRTLILFPITFCNARSGFRESLYAIKSISNTFSKAKRKINFVALGTSGIWSEISES
jgi:hypothetical protein